MDTNMDNRRVRILQLGILALNVVSVMGLSIFIYATIENIRRSYVAREFLSGIQAIVWYPYWNIWLCALLLALLAGSMFVRDRLFPDNSKVILFSLVADFAICFAIIILLNFNYNGILLLVFSNVILYAKNGKSRYLLAAVAIGSFILADYELLSISYRLYSIQDYISFYNATTQQYLLSSYNILVSLNVIMFVVYCVNIINLPEDERSRMIDAEWQMAEGASNNEQYSTEIKIFANNRIGMFADISKVFTEKQIDITSMNVRTSKQGKATIIMTFDIHGTDELNRLTDKIRQIEGVLDIERTTG